MRCVKTGLKFQVHPDVINTYTGDLFYCGSLNCLLLRGISSGTMEVTPHVIFEADSDIFKVTENSYAFASWWGEWNRGIDMQLPCIIDDTRFFN